MINIIFKYMHCGYIMSQRTGLSNSVMNLVDSINPFQTNEIFHKATYNKI